MESVAKREGQVAVQLVELEKAVENLVSVVTCTEEGLRGIIRSAVQGKVSAEPEQELVPLANTIRTCAQRVERETGNLKGILSRLEI